MMRSHDNSILAEFRADWRWVQNEVGLIQEYIDDIDVFNWTALDIDPTPDEKRHAAAVLRHMLGVRLSIHKQEEL